MSQEQAQVLASQNQVVSDSEQIRQALAAVSGPEAAAEVAEAAKLMDAEAAAAQAPAAEAEAAPAEAATVEEKPAAPVKTEAADDEKYKTWEAVKAAEKRNRAIRDQIKQEKAALDAAKKDIEDQRAKIKADHDELVNDPLGVLKKRGTTFEDMARRVIADGKMSPEEMVKRMGVEMQEKLSTIEKSNQELRDIIQKQEEQRYVNDYRSQIQKTLSTAEFELLSGYDDAMDMVFNKATAHAAEHKEVLTPEQAAAIIQDELRDGLTKLKSHKAARRILGLPDSDESDSLENTASSSPGVSQTPKRAVTSPKTLTNKTAVVSSKTFEDEDFVDEREEIRRAAKLIAPDAWK